MRKKRILSEEHKRKIGDAARGKKHPPLSEESLIKIRKTAAKRKGISTGPCTEEVKERIRQATLGKKKTITKPNPSWFPKGHISEKPFVKGNKSWNEGKFLTETRMGNKYQFWRNSILERDDNKCKNCGSIERLHCHHIIPWKVDKTKRFDIDNGITLCNSCHSKIEGISLAKRDENFYIKAWDKKREKRLKDNGNTKLFK